MIGEAPEAEDERTTASSQGSSQGVLGELLADLAPSRSVRFGAPASAEDDIALAALAVLVDDTSRSTRSTSIRLRTRYAASVGVGDGEGLSALEGLAAACAVRSDLVVVDEATTGAWYDRGVPAGRVGFLFDVLVRHHQPAVEAPRVRRPVEVDLRPARTLRGRVVSTSGSPVPGARVTAGRHGASCSTDGAGRFHLTLVEPGPAELWVQVKGRRFALDAGEGPEQGDVQLVVGEEER